MKLITKINLILMLPMVGIILIMGIITLSVLITNTLNWSDIVQEHIINQELTNLQIRVDNLRNSTKLYFGKIVNDNLLVKDYAELVINDKISIDSFYPNFYGSKIGTKLPFVLPPGGIDTFGLNPEFSVWFNRINYDPNLELRLNETSIFDNVWRSIYYSNRVSDSKIDYLGLYVGINSGLFRYFPYNNLDSFSTMTYVCLADNQFTTGYDPRCRSWYIDSQANPDNVIFTRPYNDASTGKVLISSAVAIRENGNLIGSIAFDISMESLKLLVSNEKILANGYSFLVTIDGNLVIHPDIDQEKVYQIQQLEFEDDQNGVFFQMIQRLSGQMNYTKKDTEQQELWWITWQHVGLGNYILASVVPHPDVVESITEINQKVQTSLTIAIIIMGLLVIAITVLAIFINNKLAKRVTGPIFEFTQMTKDMTEGKLDEEYGYSSAKSCDMKNLHEKFKNLIIAVRYANDDYGKNNYQKALENYREVEKMLEKLDNKIGLGVVQNNIGNVLLKISKDDANEARDYLLKSIENAEQLIKKYESENEGDDNNYLNESYDEKNEKKKLDKKKKKKETTDKRVLFFKIKLASRTCNLGWHYYQTNCFDEATKCYKKSIKLSKEIDDKLGEMKTLGNYAILVTKKGHRKKAKKLLQEAYDTALELYKNNDTAKNAEVLQYAAKNMGIYLKDEGNLQLAIQYINYALAVSESIDQGFKNTCLGSLVQIYEQLGNFSQADKIKQVLKFVGEKHVIFVLDCSGSMGGDAIKTCRKSIISILNENMNSGDQATLITFEDNYKIIFKNKTVAKHKQQLIQDVNNKTRTQGATAFYDAVFAAAKQISNNDKMDSDSEWIVALTDGADNKSTHKPKYISEFIEKNRIHLIVIAYGNLSNKNSIELMVKKSPNGMLLNANNLNDIKEAFSNAIEIINQGQVTQEVL